MELHTNKCSTTHSLLTMCEVDDSRSSHSLPARQMISDDIAVNELPLTSCVHFFGFG